uniref:DH domain-containing protein n=1 Tax=Macrostomum lignano TaxID=282301 RepID=A0A1I8IG71_9PLAT
MSSSLDSDGLLRQQQQQNLRRQSQQSSDPASAIQVVDLPEADSIATAAALGRQSRSPSLQPLSPANGELSATPSAAAADSESDQAKDESSQQARTQPPQPLAPSDHVSGHPDIRSVQVDFHAYIMDMDLNGRLAELRKTYDKDFDRLKEYQLALHEMVFSSMSHLRALTILQQLFVQHWPAAYKETLNQLGLHFVPDCIALYKSLLASLRGPSLEEFRISACLLEQFGERLLAWYTADDHVFEFKRLSLSFGFAKTATKRKTSNINEDDIILKLISLRRDNQDFNGFFSRAEAHPVMNKRRFVDLYSVNMQQTMRMVTLLDAAVKKAKKAKSACSFAAKDAENLEACLSIAKDISDYSNNIGVKLKELSRQLVLSKSFSNFWEKSMMDESQVHRFRNQISHLHTCRLYLTREVHMPGLDNYRLRLFVFTEFLLVISESDENRTTKYQLLKHLGEY